MSGVLGSIASLFCCIPLLSPLAWKAHFVMLIFPIALLISELGSRPKAKISYGLAIILVAVFVLFNLTSPRIIGLAASEWVDRHSLISGAAMLIYLGAIYSGLRGAANYTNQTNGHE